MNKMREKLQRFMYGRYGNDRLNQVMMIAALAGFALSLFGVRAFYLLSLLLLFFTYFRMLSRNGYQRSLENQWYLRQESKVRGFFAKKKRQLRQRKQFHIYRCPNCRQKIRVPRGRGKIAISCRKCGTEFIKKS